MLDANFFAEFTYYNIDSHPDRPESCLTVYGTVEYTFVSHTMNDGLPYSIANSGERPWY
jgi:hypothetical protein